jgi:hypothetical protein
MTLMVTPGLERPFSRKAISFLDLPRFLPSPLISPCKVPSPSLSPSKHARIGFNTRRTYPK